MDKIAFNLSSREEVSACEDSLREYCKFKVSFELVHVSLTRAYDALEGRADRSRLIASLFDIQISFLALFMDSTTVGGIWNERFSKGKLEGGSVLDSREKFFGKMELYRYSSAFVLRYRALWDKIMGFLILLFTPNEYEKFIEAKRKRRFFCRVARGIPQLKLAVDGIDEALSKFDSKFRTSEAHGPGVIRKFNFVMASITDDPLTELSMYWNFINRFLSNLAKLF